MRKAVKKNLVLAVFIVVVFGVHSAYADETITWGTATDGSQTTGYDPVSGRTELSGRFTPAVDTLYATPHIWMYKVGTPASIDIAIRDDLAGVPHNSLGTTTVSTIGVTTGSCAEFTFPMLAENLTAGTQYWLSLDTVPGVTNSSNYFQVCFENADPDNWGDWQPTWGGVNIDYRGYMSLLTASTSEGMASSTGTSTDRTLGNIAFGIGLLVFYASFAFVAMLHHLVFRKRKN